jgi:hypothetical protein
MDFATLIVEPDDATIHFNLTYDWVQMDEPEQADRINHDFSLGFK